MFASFISVFTRVRKVSHQAVWRFDKEQTVNPKAQFRLRVSRR